MKRIGILGGSFNPPHEGHLSIAQHAFDEMGLDEVWLLVTPQNPHKDQSRYAPLPARMDMANILAEDHDWLKPTDIEKSFSSTNTADSLTILSEMHPDTQFVWIMGADNLASFHKWDREEHSVNGQIVPDWQYIMHNFPVAVMTRPGQEEAALESKAAKFGKAMQIDDPKEMGQTPQGWCFIDNPPVDVSSTQILADLEAGTSPVNGLPAKIEKQILKKKLYHLTDPQKKIEEPAPRAAYPDDIVGLLCLAATIQYLKAKGEDEKAVTEGLREGLSKHVPLNYKDALYNMSAALISGNSIPKTLGTFLQVVTHIDADQAAGMVTAIYESDYEPDADYTLKHAYEKIKAIADYTGTFIPRLPSRPDWYPKI